VPLGRELIRYERIHRQLSERLQENIPTNSESTREKIESIVNGDKDTIKEYLNYDRNAHRKGMDNIIKSYKEFDDNIMHSTNIPITEDRWNGRTLRGVADVIEWMDREMRNEGMSGIYITSKKSLLYKENKLRYKEIINEVD